MTYFGNRVIALTLALLLLALSVLPVPLSAIQTAAAQEEPFVVTFLFADNWNDEGWNMAHKTGVDQLRNLGEVIEEDDLSFTVKIDGEQYPDLGGRLLKVDLVTDVGYGTEIQGVMQKAIETQNPDLVFATWWNAKDAVAELSPDYPDVNFEHCSGYPVIKSEDFSAGNVSTYFAKMEDSDFAVGYAAGLMGYDKIGLVATYPIPEPVRGVNAFALGLKKGLAEANNDPKDAEVQVIWIESWLDIQKEQLATETLLGMGYKTIRQMPDTPTTSMTACNAEANVLGYGSDVLPKAPCALVSNVWQWGSYYTQRVIDAMMGEWTAQDWFDGWNADAVGLVWNPDAPDDIQAKAEALIEEIKAGTADPFAGPITGRALDENGDEIAIEIPEGSKVGDMGRLTMQWLVDGVISPLPAYPSGGHDLDLVEME